MRINLVDEEIGLPHFVLNPPIYKGFRGCSVRENMTIIMNEENEEYYIYKVVNNKNSCVYIGATTDSVEQRKLDHVKRANRGESGKFQEAINTYGAEAFVWEQIDTAITTDELAQKEKEYILEYKAKETG